MGSIDIAAPSARVMVAVFCPLHQVGKRRGGAKLALKTGMVAKKHKADEEVRIASFSILISTIWLAKLFCTSQYRR